MQPKTSKLPSGKRNVGGRIRKRLNKLPVWIGLLAAVVGIISGAIAIRQYFNQDRDSNIQPGSNNQITIIQNRIENNSGKDTKQTYNRDSLARSEIANQQLEPLIELPKNTSRSFDAYNDTGLPIINGLSVDK